VYAEGPVAWVDVVSGGPPAPGALAHSQPGDEGMHLGLTIVRWIAAQHGGRLRYEHVEGRNVFGFSLRPVRADVSRVTAEADQES
jgi:hypothetical protein